jgi:hypothetical protein
MHQISDFLKKFKEKAEKDGLILVRRKKNLDFLAYINLPWYEAKEIIFGLTEEQYVRGPMADKDGYPGEVWEFKAEYAGSEIYIKLKLDTEAKCISFHSPERPMI